MSANLNTRADGSAAFAFIGPREDIWHRMGQQLEPGMSLDVWANAAGMAWHAELRQAYYPAAGGELQPVLGHHFIARSDNDAVLGHCTDSYKPVQPRDVLAWFTDYVRVDDRFMLDAAGVLGGGERVWATATFNSDMTVADDAHRARLLMSTSFDGSQATRNQGTMTRVVCQNTLRIAQGDNRAVISTRHSSRFNPTAVARELGEIAKGFTWYKEMGEGLARAAMPKTDVSAFFKSLLQIPFDAKESDVSARKMKQFRDLSRAYTVTVTEGTERDTAWTALNAVTRWVDHDRPSRGSSKYGSEEVARFMSAQFGTGNELKQQAAALLADYARSAPRAGGVPVPTAMAALV